MPDTTQKHTIPATDPTSQELKIYITEEGFAVFVQAHHCIVIEQVHEAENRPNCRKTVRP